jgi:hypothetical protein
MKPQICLNRLISGTNLDTSFSPRMAQTFVYFYVIYIELNTLSPTLFFFSVWTEKLVYQNIWKFSRNPQYNNQSRLFFSLKYFSKFFKFTNFPIILLHLTKPSRETIISYDILTSPLAQQLVVRSVFLQNLLTMMMMMMMIIIIIKFLEIFKLAYTRRFINRGQMLGIFGNSIRKCCRKLTIIKKCFTIRHV